MGWRASGGRDPRSRLSHLSRDGHLRLGGSVRPLMMLRGFVVATRFLTRIPMPGRPVEGHELSESVAWFPLVGALIGGATAGIIVVTSPWLGQSSVVLGLICGALITGGLHEDGLAHACDGLRLGCPRVHGI